MRGSGFTGSRASIGGNGEHEGLWVSSPAPAVLEVAAVGTKDELIDVIDAGMALRRFTPGDLKLVLARNRPCRGAAREVRAVRGGLRVA